MIRYIMHYVAVISGWSRRSIWDQRICYYICIEPVRCWKNEFSARSIWSRHTEYAFTNWCIFRFVFKSNIIFLFLNIVETGVYSNEYFQVKVYEILVKFILQTHRIKQCTLFFQWGIMPDREHGTNKKTIYQLLTMYEY